MDTTAQIKNNLISRIKTSSDLSFLKALQTIFDSSEQGLFQLSSDQEASILRGRKQIEIGEFSSNESVISEMKEWLKKE
jgi:predicted transcriptional regulator